MLIRGFGKNCNLSEYKERINAMKGKILAIVQAFFTCNEKDCTDVVSKAVSDYKAYRSTFTEFTRCSLTKYSPECGLIIFEVRPLTFCSAENIIASMTQCAILKSQQKSDCATVSNEVKG